MHEHAPEAHRDPLEATVVLRFPLADPRDARDPRWPEEMRQHVAGLIADLRLAAPGMLNMDVYFDAPTEEAQEDSSYPDGFESDPRLDTPITNDFIMPYLRSSDIAQANRLVNAVGNSGARTVRGVLALGEDGLGAAKNIAWMSKKRIRDALNDLGVAWLSEPAMPDLVRICRNLGEVPIAVAAGHLAVKSGKYTVRSVVDASVAELAQNALGSTAEDRTAKAREAFAAAQIFARKFEAAKAEYMSSRSGQGQT